MAYREPWCTVSLIWHRARRYVMRGREDFYDINSRVACMQLQCGHTRQSSGKCAVWMLFSFKVAVITECRLVEQVWILLRLASRLLHQRKSIQPELLRSSRKSPPPCVWARPSPRALLYQRLCIMLRDILLLHNFVLDSSSEIELTVWLCLRNVRMILTCATDSVFLVTTAHFRYRLFTDVAS